MHWYQKLLSLPQRASDGGLKVNERLLCASMPDSVRTLTPYIYLPEGKIFRSTPLCAVFIGRGI